jgi:hypothetical protein
MIARANLAAAGLADRSEIVLALFWAHDLQALTDFIETTRDTAAQ